MNEHGRSNVERVVLDASAVVRALTARDGRAAEWVRRLDDRENATSTPDLLFAEVAHAFLRYVRAGLLAIDVARDNVEFVCALPLQVWPVQRLAPAAFEVAHERQLSAYDACYVALAHAEDAMLVTADRRLAAAADRAELVA